MRIMFHALCYSKRTEFLPSEGTFLSQAETRMISSIEMETPRWWEFCVLFRPEIPSGQEQCLLHQTRNFQMLGTITPSQTGSSQKSGIISPPSDWELPDVGDRVSPSDWELPEVGTMSPPSDWELPELRILSPPSDWELPEAGTMSLPSDRASSEV